MNTITIFNQDPMQRMHLACSAFTESNSSHRMQRWLPLSLLHCSLCSSHLHNKDPVHLSPLTAPVANYTLAAHRRCSRPSRHLHPDFGVLSRHKRNIAVMNTARGRLDSVHQMVVRCPPPFVAQPPPRTQRPISSILLFKLPRAQVRLIQPLPLSPNTRL